MTFRPYSYTLQDICQNRERLGEFELIVLLALLRLSENAYGVPIRREIEKRTKRSVSVGALYRLEAKSYVSSWFSDPIPERGGRAKRFFHVEALGMRVLRQTDRDLQAMWDGIDLKQAPYAS